MYVCVKCEKVGVERSVSNKRGADKGGAVRMSLCDREDKSPASWGPAHLSSLTHSLTHLLTHSPTHSLT